MARTLVKSKQYVQSAPATVDDSYTGGSYTPGPNGPVLTFTALGTGQYKVYTNVALNKAGASTYGLIKVSNTAGGAAVVLEQPVIILDNDVDDWQTQQPFSYYNLVAGVSYTFQIEAQVTGSTLAILYSLLNSTLVAEQVL
jgi:hypothetical protein